MFIIPLSCVGISYILNLQFSKYLESKYQNTYHANMIQTSLHSSLLAFSGIHFIFFQNLILFDIFRYYSMGHLLADAYHFHYLNNVNGNWKTYVSHHILFLISWIAIKYYKIYLIYSYCLLMEITVLPMNLKFYYKNRNNKKMDTFYSFLTYFLFLFFRVINFSFQYRKVFHLGYPELSILFVPMLSLQYYWFYLMSVKVKKFLTG